MPNKKVIAASLLGASLAVGVGGYAISVLVMTSRAEYVPASQLTSPAEINRIILKSMRPSEGLPIEKVARELTGRVLQSGGEKLIVYRFNFARKTCGKAGCLYVVASPNGLTKPLQLFELPDGGELFIPTPKPRCFKVLQPVQGRIEDYEICQSS